MKLNLSSSQRCVRSRKVAVFEEQPGPDVKLGTDTSDSNGGWSLMVLTPDFDFSASYHAKVIKRRLGGTTCDGARSASASPGP